MREEGRFVDRLMTRVFRIVTGPRHAHDKLEALQKLAARLGAAAAKCKSRLEHAKIAGNSAVQVALRKQLRMLEAGVQYVSSRAAECVQRKPRLSFQVQPAPFASPRWDR